VGGPHTNKHTHTDVHTHRYTDTHTHTHARATPAVRTGVDAVLDDGRGGGLRRLLGVLGLDGDVRVERAEPSGQRQRLGMQHSHLHRRVLQLRKRHHPRECTLGVEEGRHRVGPRARVAEHVQVLLKDALVSVERQLARLVPRRVRHHLGLAAQRNLRLELRLHLGIRRLGLRGLPSTHRQPHTLKQRQTHTCTTHTHTHTHIHTHTRTQNVPAEGGGPRQGPPLEPTLLLGCPWPGVLAWCPWPPLPLGACLRLCLAGPCRRGRRRRRVQCARAGALGWAPPAVHPPAAPGSAGSIAPAAVARHA
jgi:hypothetical protein